MAWSGTAAEKRAYAIKKSKERAKSSQEGAGSRVPPRNNKPLPGYEIHPNNHRCDFRTINYKSPVVLYNNKDFFSPTAECKTCGRKWGYQFTGSGPDDTPYYKQTTIPMILPTQGMP